jgi:hypothetical protein
LAIDRNLGLHYHVLLPPVAAGFVLALATALDEVAKLAGTQKAVAGRLRDLARAKQQARETLRTDMLAIHRIATALAIETPGFDVKFQMPLKGDARLLAAARSFAELAAPLSEVFTKLALPDRFLDDLNAHIQDFEHTTTQYVDGSHACDAVSSAIQKAIANANVASTHLDAIARNTLTSDPPKLEAWEQVCVYGRTRSAPREKPDKPDSQAPEVATSKAA